MLQLADQLLSLTEVNIEGLRPYLRLELQLQSAEYSVLVRRWLDKNREAIRGNKTLMLKLQKEYPHLAPASMHPSTLGGSVAANSAAHPFVRPFGKLDSKRGRANSKVLTSAAPQCRQQEEETALMEATLLPIAAFAGQAASATDAGPTTLAAPALAPLKQDVQAEPESCVNGRQALLPSDPPSSLGNEAAASLRQGRHGTSASAAPDASLRATSNAAVDGGSDELASLLQRPAKKMKADVPQEVSCSAGASRSGPGTNPWVPFSAGAPSHAVAERRNSKSGSSHGWMDAARTDSASLDAPPQRMSLLYQMLNAERLPGPAVNTVFNLRPIPDPKTAHAGGTKAKVSKSKAAQNASSCAPQARQASIACFVAGANLAAGHQAVGHAVHTVDAAGASRQPLSNVTNDGSVAATSTGAASAARAPCKPQQRHACSAASREKWSGADTQYFIGLARQYRKQWAAIERHAGRDDPPRLVGRTQVNLKDKWRNLVKKGVVEDVH